MIDLSTGECCGEGVVTIFESTSFIASLAGSGVEFLETAAIAHALARTGSAAEAIIGTVLGSLLIGLPAYAAWPWLARIPIHVFQCAVSTVAHVSRDFCNSSTTMTS